MRIHCYCTTCIIKVQPCYRLKPEVDYEKTDVIYAILHQASLFKFELSEKDLSSKKDMTPFTVVYTVVVHKI